MEDGDNFLIGLSIKLCNEGLDRLYGGFVNDLQFLADNYKDIKVIIFVHGADNHARLMTVDGSRLLLFDPHRKPKWYRKYDDYATFLGCSEIVMVPGKQGDHGNCFLRCVLELLLMISAGL